MYFLVIKEFEKGRGFRYEFENRTSIYTSSIENLLRIENIFKGILCIENLCKNLDKLFRKKIHLAGHLFREDLIDRLLCTENKLNGFSVGRIFHKNTVKQSSSNRREYKGLLHRKFIFN